MGNNLGIKDIIIMGIRIHSIKKGIHSNSNCIKAIILFLEIQVNFILYKVVII